MFKRNKGKRATLKGLQQKLDGGSCLNQRSLLLACRVLCKKQGGATISLSELLETLWVLELMIVSKGISHDGTLPAGDLAQLRQELETLTSGLQTALPPFRAITPKSEAEQIEFAKSAALKALDDLATPSTASRQGAPSPGIIKELDRPLTREEAETFFGALEQRLKNSTADGVSLVSEDEALNMLGGSFRGSKCVAGILALGTSAVKAAVAAPGIHGCSPELAAGAFINRFRFSYIRQLSFGAHHVYVPAASWKRLSEFHAITFAEVVRRHFQQTYADEFTKEIERHLEAELGGDDRTFTIALPPIGLYCLMKADPKRGPRGVLESALETYSDYGQLFRKFWKTTREIEPPLDGWTVITGDRNLDRVSEPIEQFLSDRLGRLEKAALGPAGNGSRLDRYLTPIIKASATVGGTLVGIIAGANPSVGSLTGAAVGAAAGWAAEHLYETAKGKLFSHVDQYRALDGALLRAYSRAIRLDRLAAQVESVLDRQLTGV